MAFRVWDKIRKAFHARGGTKYMISEPITQQQHALQTYLAMRETVLGAHSRNLRVAALLHDIGHLLEGEPIDPEYGVNDYHELKGAKWLAMHGFPEPVYVPIMFHVDAKRYMCTQNPKYRESLSEGSMLSLNLQGGAMSPLEMKTFEEMPYYEETMLLRQCDDMGKNVGLKSLPDLESLKEEVESVLQ